MPNGQVPDEVYRGNCNIGLHYVTSSQYEASIQKFRSMGIVFTTLVNEPLYAVLNTKSPLSKLDKDLSGATSWNEFSCRIYQNFWKKETR